MFLLCLSSSCIPCVASFFPFDCSVFITPSIFSNVYCTLILWLIDNDRFNILRLCNLTSDMCMLTLLAQCQKRSEKRLNSVNFNRMFSWKDKEDYKSSKIQSDRCADGGIIDLYEKGCSVRLYLRLFVVGLVSYLGYLSLFAYSGVQCSCFVCLRLKRLNSVNFNRMFSWKDKEDYKSSKIQSDRCVGVRQQSMIIKQYML
jgi:hypothetical protein